jgi:pyruvate kinase
MIETVEQLLEASKFAHRGDIVGIVAGTRTRTGATNFMRLHVLGDLVNGDAKASEVQVAANV